MKRYTMYIISILIMVLATAFTPLHAQVVDIPRIPTQEENESLATLKAEYTKLALVIPRLENTITLLTKRGFNTEKAQETLEETKEYFAQTKELFEKKNIKKATIEESVKEARLLLAKTIREIRLSLLLKEN